MGRRKEILVIKAGGTICQQPDANGILHIPGHQDYMHLVPGLEKFAHVTEKEIDPIDSTNMNLPDRKKLVDIVRRNHKKYDGFVIIQGTDTMAESAIATNYMIQGLGKPIIFTGSQLPIYEYKTDAIKNVEDAVKVATADIGESAIVFDGRVIRGSRAAKKDSEDFYAFYSPKVGQLGSVKDEISLEGQIKRHLTEKPKFFTNFKKNVHYFHQISGADTNILEKIVQDCDISGLIIGGYGTGNVNDKYLRAIEQATQRGKPVAITTACQYGTTNPKYAVGAAALEAGAFLAYDLNREAAGQKMMYALGVAESKGVKDTVSEVKKIMQTPIGKDMIITK